MAITPLSTSPQKPVLTARERLDQAQRELARLRARINRSAVLTGIVGVLALLLLAGYFYYGARLWAEVTEPETLVNYAHTTFDDYLHDARGMIEREVTKSAPGWAADLSKQLLAGVPDARKKLEVVVVDELDKSIQEADLITETELRKFLRAHRKEMDEHFKELAKHPKLAEQSVAELFTALEDDLQVDLKADAAKLLKMVKAANRNWRELQHGRKLSEDQKLERRAWMVGRLLYLQTFEPELVRKFQASAKLPKDTGTPKRKVPQPKIQPKEKKTDPKSDAKPAKTGQASIRVPWLAGNFHPAMVAVDEEIFLNHARRGMRLPA